MLPKRLLTAANWLMVVVVLVTVGAYVVSARSSPPLGWNTWQAFETAISEQVVMREAAWFIANLKQYGWEYIVVDGGWDTDPKTGKQYTDGNARTIPDPNAWPSSAKGVGLKALADVLHKQGVKVGLHLMRGLSVVAVENNEPIAGTPYHAKDIALANDKCDWDDHWYGINMSHPGGQAFYDSLVSQMAGWGIDFIKVDCLGFGRDQHNNDIKAIASSIKKVKNTHEIIYSLSPGAAAQPSDVGDINTYTDMYRITDDLWDCWNLPSNAPGCKVDGTTIVSAFSQFPKWENLIAAKGLNGPSFPDGDMLPLSDVYPGRSTSLTEAEKKVLVTFWCIFRSPLMIGSKLTTITPTTYALLSNPEALSVNQNTTGNKLAISNPSANFYAWRAQTTDGKTFYVALFNVGSQSYQGGFSFSQVGISATKCQAYDVWEKKGLGLLTKEYQTTLPMTSTVLLRLSDCTS